MTMTYLLAVLFLITALAVLIWAIVSKARIENRMKDDAAPKSTLAADAPSDGRPVDV